MAMILQTAVATALLAGLVASTPLADIAAQSPPNTTSSYPTPASYPPTYSSSAAAKGSYKTALYFPNWDIYGRNYQPADLPVDRLTHVLYAFANVRPDTGEVYLSDTYADLEKHYSNDSWNDVGNNVYGCVKQLYLLKKRNRHMKVILSIGGWSYSNNFVGAAATTTNRQNFASTAVKFLMDLGFDGLDIDWEYPANSAQASDWVALLKATRQALDAYAATLPNHPHFLLTVACPAGPSNYEKLDIPGMDQYLDFWNLMAYDFSGSFSTVAAHASNLYPSVLNTNSTPFSTDAAVQYYLSHGVNPRKLLLGLPLYGHQFVGTQGPGLPYTGIGPGSWENGIWDYKALPETGAKVHYDSVIGASWSYDTNTQTMVSYDTPEMAEQKLQYIYQNNLGGAMWWEANGDKNTTTESLVDITIGGFTKLDGSKNVLNYPNSQYDNMRAGMPNSVVSYS
ncbi:hypothetical protein AC579_5184 [Pseudocercospora musae]|uniref:chitinase n=1 Tax=Pseudocercospora musae TaxID=113226 RepID=A0A139HEU1_9PEZI|nr:hypothetical protein AC579_5184 [Pseudocercospora musae]